MSEHPNSPTSKPDPVRPWFQALESLGEFIGIRFGRVNPETNEVTWVYLSHLEYDGIGAFAHLLRQGGVTLTDLPQITHPAPLSWGAFIRSLPAMMGPRRRLLWKPVLQGKKLDPIRQPSPAVAWHVFSEEETATIRRTARKAGVSVNSSILKYLDRAVRPYLADPSSAIPWMVPVNMRGKVNQPSETENHSSYIAIRVYASDRAQDVHRHIYDALEKGQHCGNWKAFDATRLTSESMKHRLIKADRATCQWNVGSFSNLGVWDPEKKMREPDVQGPWLFAPPVLGIQQIGAGCVTFQGRLSLTLQIHPDLTTSPEVATAWMRNWVREIELDFPTPAPAERTNGAATGTLHSSLS